MVDVTINFKIPSEKVIEYVAHYVYVHKNTETIDDPNWVDPQDGSTATQIPKFNDNQWVKEHIIRSVRAQIVRGRNAKYRDDIEAYNANDVE